MIGAEARLNVLIDLYGYSSLICDTLRELGRWPGTMGLRLAY